MRTTYLPSMSVRIQDDSLLVIVRTFYVGLVGLKYETIIPIRFIQEIRKFSFVLFVNKNILFSKFLNICISFCLSNDIPEKSDQSIIHSY